MSCSANAAAGEILAKHRSQFGDSLKDLKQLREQLYSAANYFESSYNRDSRNQFVVESSKDYVAKALVNTVDHLGSVADKLNKFLDQTVDEYSTTNTQFSCIQQRLCTIQKLAHSRALSHHLYNTKDAAVETSTLTLGKSYVLYGNRVSSSPAPDPDVVKQDNSFVKTFQTTKRVKRKMRKQDSTREECPNPPGFSFTNKEAGVCSHFDFKITMFSIVKREYLYTTERRSVSPLRLPFNLSMSRRSVSPSPSMNKGQQQKVMEARRAMSACRRRETSSMKREMEMETYTRKSKHLLKALLSLHHSRRAILNQYRQ